MNVRVVAANNSPFLHGKAGLIESRGGTKTSFIGSLNETREGWRDHYEIVWEDQSPEGVAWVEAEFQYLWDPSRPKVDVLNLVYADTNNEKVYRVLSQRMKDRYDLFGS